MKLKPPTKNDYPNHIVSEPLVRDRRLSGVHWWDPDRAHHLDDLPLFCPQCGASVAESGGLSVEYWEANERTYHTWCHTCGWAGDITRVDRMIAPEAEH